jgi:hypothetical protein
VTADSADHGTVCETLSQVGSAAASSESALSYDGSESVGRVGPVGLQDSEARPGHPSRIRLGTSRQSGGARAGRRSVASPGKTPGHSGHGDPAWPAAT